ncbi:9404_t:CDS:2, partial [Acaulospora colombiana]
DVMKNVDGEPETVFETLAYKLTGVSPPQVTLQEFDQDSREMGRQSEIEAVQAVYPSATYDSETSILSIPCLTAPVSFHVIYPKLHPYPETTRIPPFYISSNSISPYIRLHLTSVVFSAIAPNGERYENESICFNAIEALEAGWEAVEANGPPKLEDVLRNLLPPPTKTAASEEMQLPTGKAKSTSRSKSLDSRTDQHILEEFQTLKASKAYKVMEEARKRLPAWDNREKIKQMIIENQIIIVVGETAVPQFILDGQIESLNGSKTSIIVTQPRRVSVLGVSARVSAERIEDGSVGYSIRGESRTKPTTKLLFCTTGVLLRRMASGDRLESVTHVVVDEVHERSVDSDFLLLELREIIKSNKNLKIILMSATINQRVFSEYFHQAPVIEIPGRTFPVDRLYLEDLLPKIDYRPSLVRGSERLTAEQSESFQTYFEKAGVPKEV